MLFSCFCTPVSVFCNWILTVSHSSASVLLALPSFECKGNEVNQSWQRMCACATTEKALCSPPFSQRSFVCCYESMPAARCYIGSRDQGKIGQKSEYISVNGEAAFSSSQTMW